MSSKLTTDSRYKNLLGRISEVYAAGQLRAHQAVNLVISETYWQIGHDIVEFEQGGKARANYGKGLLTTLSRDLALRHGKGFSRSNVIRMRQFYLAYPKGATASHLLSWSHWVELLKLDAAEHHDIGQMNLYLGYFAAEENTESDNPAIGIILTRHKAELLVEYATYQMNSQLFVQKYQLYLPDRDELRRALELSFQDADNGDEMP